MSDTETLTVDVWIYTLLWRCAYHTLAAAEADCGQSHDNLLRHALDAAREAERLRQQKFGVGCVTALWNSPGATACHCSDCDAKPVVPCAVCGEDEIPLNDAGECQRCAPREDETCAEWLDRTREIRRTK